MTADTYLSPQGDVIDAARERELIRLALNDAWGFEYHAPGTRDWWAVFWESLERHGDDRAVSGQAPLDAYAQPDGSVPLTDGGPTRHSAVTRDGGGRDA